MIKPIKLREICLIDVSDEPLTLSLPYTCQSNKCQRSNLKWAEKSNPSRNPKSWGIHESARFVVGVVGSAY